MSSDRNRKLLETDRNKNITSANCLSFGEHDYSTKASNNLVMSTNQQTSQLHSFLPTNESDDEENYDEVNYLM